VDFDATDQLLSINYAIVKYLRNNEKYSEAVHQLFRDFKEAYDSVRRVVLYNIPNEFGIPMKMVRLTKMCLNDTYSRVQVGKHLSDVFPTRNALKQGEVLLLLLFNCVLEYAIWRVKVHQCGLKLNY
jgi:hypothetical protein